MNHYYHINVSSFQCCFNKIITNYFLLFRGPSTTSGYQWYVAIIWQSSKIISKRSFIYIYWLIVIFYQTHCQFMLFLTMQENHFTNKSPSGLKTTCYSCRGALIIKHKKRSTKVVFLFFSSREEFEKRDARSYFSRNLVSFFSKFLVP